MAINKWLQVGKCNALSGNTAGKGRETEREKKGLSP